VELNYGLFEERLKKRESEASKIVQKLALNVPLKMPPFI